MRTDPQQSIGVWFDEISFVLLDAVCLGLVLQIAWIIPAACRTNVVETPIDGVPQGSSYNSKALCNEAWVARHSRRASQIRELPDLNNWSTMFAAAIVQLTGYYVLPAVVLLYLFWRMRSVRRAVVHRTVLAFQIVVLLFAIPFLQQCVIVILD